MKSRRLDSTSAIMKAKGKSVPIKIDKNTQKEIKDFKRRLQEMIEYDNIRETDKLSIQIILNEIDPYDQNILIAYYGLADGSSTALAKLFGVGHHVISKRIRKITKKIYDRTAMLADSLGIPHRL